MNNSEVKTNPETTSAFWDCNCSLNYINPKSSGACKTCGADYEGNPQDYPDSRLEELKEPCNIAHVQQMNPTQSSKELDWPKHKVEYVFGVDNMMDFENGDDSVVEVFEFDTKQELDAFHKGMAAVDGWDGYEQVNYSPTDAEGSAHE